MKTLVTILIAGVIFWLILKYLIPMLPGAMQIFVTVLVVLAAIIFLLSLITGFNWPWNKT